MGDKAGRSERAEARGPELTGVAARRSAGYDAVKRFADILFAAIALTLSLPFWIWATILVVLADGRPILYSQTRVGRGGRVFTIYKFRSMVKDAEKHTGAVLSDKNDPRVTSVGRLMRKTAVHEIPQLISIFRGDMSWVGPRPERGHYLVYTGGEACMRSGVHSPQQPLPRPPDLAPLVSEHLLRSLGR